MVLELTDPSRDFQETPAVEEWDYFMGMILCDSHLHPFSQVPGHAEGWLDEE